MWSKSRFICPTVQSKAYGLEWLGVICTTETYQGFLLFFLRKEALLTPLTSTHNFSQISFSLLHLTVVKILVQLTLLISKTGFRVWVLDWSVRHIFFFLHMNHWSISLSLYQQRVLPRHHWAFGPIKMGPIICCDPFFQM